MYCQQVCSKSDLTHPTTRSLNKLLCSTLTETNIAPENRCLEDDPFLLGWPSGRCEMLVSGEYIYIYTLFATKRAVRIQKIRGNCRCLPPNTPGDRTENRTRVAGLSILCSVTQWSSSESVPWVVEAAKNSPSPGKVCIFFLEGKQGKSYLFP